MMPLTLPDAPDEGLEIIRRNVPLLLGGGMFGFDGGSPEVARPYPLYTSTIPALMEGRLLASAVLTAWAYPLFVAGSVLALGEVAATTAEGEQRLGFAALHPPPFAQPILEAIARAEQLPQVDAGHYEVRILRAPSLMLLAIWLHGTTDLLIPITPRTKANWDESLDTNITSEAALIESLRELAQVRLTAKDY